ncbi:GNAT family N-acetyltransferase [Ochrobactrum sp. Marseille-Q0166]|uniref:GNAT family N-acetyltransferase n=1 Tax=Ochrobactrum sp. Marseille-Q0166 TaxID=2761105 RepID=UPI001655FD5B|nr:GNAT family N-acetyltransferase [Ochrobactrum sp. Marseille-Q0166]MBC8716729.1 GNAT family N-acetyltransferase [Ochrobactrum sp. Marseille-Q0166]
MISLLNFEEAKAAVPALAEILTDCVNSGASVGFMAPSKAHDFIPYWNRITNEVESGDTALLVAEHNGEIVGTVQLGLAQMPNQPHRADLKKLLIHRKARGLGLARKLMEAVEEEARNRHKTLLCLDTATGSPAEAIYTHLGWERVGVIPNYALYPDGSPCATTLFYKGL